MSRRALGSVVAAVAIALIAAGLLAASVLSDEPLPGGVTVETVVEYPGGDFPVAMAFTPDGRILFTEKGGYGGSPHTTRVRVVENGVLRSQPWLTLSVVANSERGLLGIAVDPDFASNGYVYVFYTHPPTLTLPFNRVSRFTDVGGAGVDETVLLDIPEVDGEANHNGGNLHFGPDGKLYVSVGESGGTPARAQDLTQVHGKILRIHKEDGAAPTDNPFFDGGGPNEDRIWSLGHRNPFDFDFDPFSGHLFAIDNGPQCNDEINRVLSGLNYGWPFEADYSGFPCPYLGNPAYTPPLTYWSSTIAPAGIVVYDGGSISEWSGDLLVCASNTSGLYRARLNGARNAVVSVAPVGLPAGVYCGTDVEVGPDGSVYMLAWTISGNFMYRIRGSGSPADLGSSRKAIEPRDPLPGDPVTYTIDVINGGSASTLFTLTDTFHPSTTLASSPQVTTGSLISTAQGLTWSGTISGNAGLRLTYRMTVSSAIVSPTLISNAALLTGAGASRTLQAGVVLLGQHVYLPLIVKSALP